MFPPFLDLGPPCLGELVGAFQNRTRGHPTVLDGLYIVEDVSEPLCGLFDLTPRQSRHRRSSQWPRQFDRLVLGLGQRTS